jgi:hypothetical protein
MTRITVGENRGQRPNTSAAAEATVEKPRGVENHSNQHKRVKSGAADRIGDDLIWGGNGIAEELDISPRKAFHLLETRAIPARKLRGRWVASRRELRRFFTGGAV